MRTVLGLGLALTMIAAEAAAGPPPSPPTIVQTAHNDHTGSTTFTQAFPSAQSAGNTNLVFLAFGNGAPDSLTNIHDTNGNAYTFVGLIRGDAMTTLYVYISVGIVAGANTVSVTTSVATTFPELFIMEIAGTSGIDASALNGGGTNLATASATSIADQCLAIGYCYNNDTATGAGAGFALIVPVTSFGAAAEEATISPPALVTATVPLASATSWSMALVLLKP